MKIANTKNTKLLTAFGATSLALLIACGTLLVDPVIPEDSSALTGNSNVGVTLQGEAIAITSATSTVTTNITPAATPTINTGTASITVATNNSTGYTLSVTATDLTNSTAGTTIPTLVDNQGQVLQNVTPANFEVNHWGVSSNSGTTYSGVNSTTPVTLKTTSARSGADTTTVTIGTKVNRDTVAGTYSNTLTFSVVTNAPPVFGGITNMQQMTSAICAAETTPAASATTVPTKQLKDTRDNKLYWVSKLADGNCWMTQNLDFIIDPNTTLTPSDTNVSENWTPATTADTINITTKFFDWGSSVIEPASVRFSSNGQDSGEPGYYVTSGSSSDDTAYNTLDDCKNAGNSEALCQHSSRGTYYNWTAAVAMNDSSSKTSGDATTSICPAGWTLPTYTGATSFEAIYDAYGITSSEAGSIAMRASPLSFVRAGAAGGGSFYGLGSIGNYWIRTALDSLCATSLDFSGSYIEPQSGGYRPNAYSVRCVAL